MKITTRKWIALLLAALMLAATAACALEESDGAKTYSDKERAKVAVTVGDKYDITKGEIVDQYEYLVEMYTYYGMAAPTADADVESMQDSVIDNLVSSKILLYKAEQMGISLDDDERAAVEVKIEEEMQYWFDSFTEQATSEGAEDVDARANELFEAALADSGMDMNVEGYREYLSEMMMNEAITTKLEETVKAEVAVTEEDVQAYYDNLLETQKEAYDADPSVYASEAEAYDMSGGNPIVYAPKGYMRVKVIMVSPEEEIDETYTTLNTELEALEQEYGKLALAEDAAANAERMAEIKTEYAEKKAEADELYAAYIADAQEKINKAYEALQSGTSFDDVLAEYGEDDIYSTYPTIAEKGILMLKESEETMDAALVEAVLALEEGAYSEVIQVGDAFYIAAPVGDEPAGEVALENVHDVIEAMALSEKAETLWTERQEEWNNDTSLVVYHEDVYRDIGKQEG